ncbi:hypothetical protein EVAR_101468_1 [Eumeta japonica]|uniref:Uncharacterized protein n=1 Tax=Eumeta variegata TaxID=151549 RepID=A0A4C1T7U9_EUMVA|nr:hypothetical protein EVAR_101468_1 [Eumeta japonica]
MSSSTRSKEWVAPDSSREDLIFLGVIPKVTRTPPDKTTANVAKSMEDNEIHSIESGVNYQSDNLASGLADSINQNVFTEMALPTAIDDLIDPTGFLKTRTMLA